MSPMGKCRMGICRHGYMSHGYMSPNPPLVQGLIAPTASSAGYVNMSILHGTLKIQNIKVML